MDHYRHQHELRSRAAQFLTWLLGSTQTQQPYTQSARQQADGFLPSQDAPEARHRHAVQEAAPMWRERLQAWAGQPGPVPAAQEGLQRPHEEPQHWHQHRQQGGGRYGR